MLFKHRRLFCISLFAILSVFLADLLPHTAKGFCFYLFTLLSLGAFLLALRYRRLFTVAFALLLAALAMLSAYQVSHKRSLLSEFGDGYRPTTVTLLSVTSKGESITGEGEMVCLSEGKRYRIPVRVLAPVDAEIGDVLFGPAVFTLSEEDSYHFSRGIYGTVRFADCRRLDKASGLRYTLSSWRVTLAERIRSALPDDDGALFCAILLGVREGLPDDFSHDMTRIGTTHILSLSGLHLVILTAGLGFLLQRLSLGKKPRLLILALFSLFFMLLTGLSTSLLRAGFMFLFALIPAFLREEGDSFTTLAAAVALICLLEPYAVRDLSLWLSALSTLGILLLFDRYKRNSHPDTLLGILRQFLITSLSITVAASLATLPLTLTAFGTLPLLSPVANLVLSPLFQAALYLAVLIAMFGSLPVIAPISHFICKLIFAITEFLGDIPRTVLSVEALSASPVLFLLFTALLLYFLFCPRRRFRFRVPVALLLSAALITMGFGTAHAIRRNNALVVSYFADEGGKSDALLFECDGDRILTVFSDFAFLSEAEKAALALVASEIDCFLLPFYTESCASYLATLLSQAKIFRLYLPPPSTLAEEEQYQEIRNTAALHEVAVITYTDAPFTLGKMSLSTLTCVSKGRVPSVLAVFHSSDIRVVFCSDAPRFSDASFALADADLCVFGSFFGEASALFPSADTPSSDTVIFCASPSYYPFDDPRGIVFSHASQHRFPFAR